MQDIRLAFRALRATPIVTAVAIVSLALGIGANTVIFSIVNSLFVRQLPIADPERLVVVSNTRVPRPGFIETWTYGIWQQIQARADAFEGSSASWTDRLNVSSGGGDVTPIVAMWVTGDYFSVLGVTPMLGRAITRDDDVQTAAPVAVISYGYWQRRFGGSASVLGRTIVIERVPSTVVGVTPPEFFGTTTGRTFDVALPLEAERLVRGNDSRIAPGRSFYGLTVFLRLKPEQTVDMATARLRAVQPQIREAAMPPASVTSSCSGLQPRLRRCPASSERPCRWLRRGRDFSTADVKTAPAVVIVNESFVRKFLDGHDPIGTTIGFDRGQGKPVTKTIVGVVADAVYQAPRLADEPIEYAPLAQLDFPISPAIDSTITVRAAAGLPERLFRSVAATIAAANPGLTCELRPLRSLIDIALTQERAVAVLSALFAAFALLLAALGLYGITAHAVASRRSEIGIPMALGAASSSVVRLIASRVAWLVAGGIVVGAGISLWATRYVAPLLFGLTTYDARTYGITAAVLIVAATFAVGPQVWRAIRIDPAEVLRES